eukprot:gene48968-65654_t
MSLLNRILSGSEMHSNGCEITCLIETPGMSGQTLNSLMMKANRPGVLRGDAHSWTWTTDGRSNTYDNPVILANRKAKRLASLLRRQPAIIKAKIRLPFVEPAIFLSSSSLSCQLEGL